MRPFELLIFDWDGTLADSERLIVDSFQAAIRALGLPPRDDSAIGQLIGLGMIEGMQTLYPELDTQELIRSLQAYRARYAGQAHPEAPLFARVEDTLRELAAADYRLAIATGKSRSRLKRSLRHHETLAGLFAATRTADETADKPDPRMLRELIGELGVPVERALMIGDTEYDAAMARAIGMPMLGVTCGVHEPQRILAAGAVALVESVRELPGWLAQGNS